MSINLFQKILVLLPLLGTTYSKLPSTTGKFFYADIQTEFGYNSMNMLVGSKNEQYSFVLQTQANGIGLADHSLCK